MIPELFPEGSDGTHMSARALVPDKDEDTSNRELAQRIRDHPFLDAAHCTDSLSGNATQQQMQVACPPGSSANDFVLIQGPGGQMMQVQIPAGVSPGQVFMVQVASPPVGGRGRESEMTDKVGVREMTNPLADGSK